MDRSLLSNGSNELHMTIWRRIKLQHLDIGTSFVNRYFDDLDICFNRSTILASFPYTGFNFSWSFDKPSGQTYDVDTQTFNAYKLSFTHTISCQMWVNKYIPYVHMHVHPSGLSTNYHNILLKVKHEVLFSSRKKVVWDAYWYTHEPRQCRTMKRSHILVHRAHAPCSHIWSLVYRYSMQNKRRSTWLCKQ